LQPLIPQQWAKANPLPCQSLATLQVGRPVFMAGSKNFLPMLLHGKSSCMWWMVEEKGCVMF
jgi:hypothetical protein